MDKLILQQPHGSENRTDRSSHSFWIDGVLQGVSVSGNEWFVWVRTQAEPKLEPNPPNWILYKKVYNAKLINSLLSYQMGIKYIWKSLPTRLIILRLVPVRNKNTSTLGITGPL